MCEAPAVLPLMPLTAQATQRNDESNARVANPAASVRSLSVFLPAVEAIETRFCRMTKQPAQIAQQDSARAVHRQMIEPQTLAQCILFGREIAPHQMKTSDTRLNG